MDGLLTFLNTTGKSFVAFSISMLIQSSVFIVLLLALDLLLRKRIRAVFRYWIWMLVLVKLVLPTTLSSPTALAYWFGMNSFRVEDKIPQITGSPETTGPSSVKTVETKPSEVFVDHSATQCAQPTRLQDVDKGSEKVASIQVAGQAVAWQGWVFLGWLVTVMVMLLLLIQRMFVVRNLLDQSAQPSEGMVKSLRQCCGRIGLSKEPELRLCPMTASPSVCGLFRPTILIPQNLVQKINTGQLKTILLHELTHIKRGDLWVSFVQTLLQILYFYNPLLWFANTVIRRIREQAVDEVVLVAMGERAEEYSAMLLNISRLTFSRPALSLRLIGVVESKKTLISRIMHIASRPFPKTAKLGLAGVLGVIIVASALLPMARAEKKDAMESQLKETVNNSELSELTGSEQSMIVRGLFTDKLGRPRGYVQLAPSSEDIWKGVRADANGCFTIEDFDPNQKDWLAYSYHCRKMALFTIPADYKNQTLEITLNSNAVIAEGRVVDRNGAGLAKKKIELVIKDRDGHTWCKSCYGKTDRYGNYEQRDVPGSSGLSIQARLADANEAEQKYITSPVSLSDNQIFVQIPTLVIGESRPEESDDGRVLLSGRVLNEKGEPIEGVEVRRLNYSTRSLTDRKGRWNMRVPAGFSSVDIRLLHPEYLSFHYDDSTRRPAKQELLDGTNIMIMKRGLRIKGFVRDSKGKAIENALVDAGRLHTWNDGGIIEDCTSARTLADGSFSIGGLPKKEICIKMSARRYAPKMVPVYIKEEMEPILVELERGRIYKGRIVDKQGNPLEAVKVLWDEWRVGKKEMRLAQHVETDSKGYFSLQGIPDEGKPEFTFSKRKSPYESFMKEMPEDLSKLDKIVMYKTPVFKGKVIDAQTEQPIDNFKLKDGAKFESTDDSIYWSRRGKRIKSEDGAFTKKWEGFIVTYPFTGAAYQKLTAKGYLPEVIGPVELGKEYEPFVIRLTKAEPLKGTVVDHEGNPAVKAEVGWVAPGKKAFIINGSFDHSGYTYQAETIIKTDPNGEFELCPGREEALIVIVHSSGYAQIESANFKNGSKIQLNPWAKIEGEIISDAQKDKVCEIRIEPIESADDYKSQKVKWMFDQRSYAQQSFVADHIPAIPLYVGRVVRWELSNPVYINAEPGKTYKIQIGGDGRSAAGKIAIGDIEDSVLSEIQFSNPRRVHAAAFQMEPESQIAAEVVNKSRNSFLWLWRDAESVYEKSKIFEKRYIPTIEDDGKFKFDNLPEGRYEFVVNVHAPLGKNVSCGRGVLKAVGVCQFTVDNTDKTELLNVPDVRLKLLSYPEVNQLAPLFEVKTFDDKIVRLKDFRGKVVLLDFWATWCSPCVDQIPKLKEIYNSFGKDERFVMIGLSVDWDVDKAKKFIDVHMLQWTQVCLGSMAQSSVVQEYGVGGIPTTILIGPKGKILTKNPDIEELKSAIKQAMDGI